MLFTNPIFQEVSFEAKFLYGLLLDRMQISLKNHWLDSQGRVFLYFRQEEMGELLGCGVKKIRCLLKELDDNTGIGLITRVRQGFGNPDFIYVKKCIGADGSNGPNKIGQKEPSREVQKTGQERPKRPTNNIEDNNTKKSNTEYPSFSSKEQETKRKETEYQMYEQIIKINIGYDYLVDEFNRRMLDEILGLMLDVVCSEQKMIRIGGDRKPQSLVKSQFLKLNAEHIRFVLNCLEKNTSKIVNIRQYLLAVLYNAPLTISNYYSSLVQHDMHEGKI